MDETPSDKELGKQLKDAGIAQVMDNNRDWADAAMNYCNTLPIGEELRWQTIRKRIARVCGQPKHPNGWGGLSRALRGLGVLVEVGKCKSDIPASHARENTVYRVAARWEWE